MSVNCDFTTIYVLGRRRSSSSVL